jgi:hypothetical protein
VREFEDGSVRRKAGYNGKEIYGAGETVWAYLIFEALGTSSDRHAMIVNLNLFDKEYPPPLGERVYIVFNPYSTRRELTFTLHHVSGPYELLADGESLGEFEPGDSFSLKLPAGGSAYITLSD